MILLKLDLRALFYTVHYFPPPTKTRLVLCGLLTSCLYDRFLPLPKVLILASEDFERFLADGNYSWCYFEAAGLSANEGCTSSREIDGLMAGKMWRK
jgi:hypothetical protein